MYNKDKIMNIIQEIVDEAKSIKPYVIVAQPRRDLNELPAQKLEGYDFLGIDFCGYSYGFINIDGKPVDVARNYLIDEAIKSGAKYLLFVGEDTVFPYDGFRILHETAINNPGAMVAGVYYIKLSSPMIMIKNGEYIHPADITPGQIFEAWLTGLDAALIPVECLKSMIDEEIPWTCVANGIDGIPFVGEDNFFIHRWRKAGFRLLVNTDVQCLHIDLASGKYTAHPDVNLNHYFTQISITERLTMDDKNYIDKRWIERIPKMQGDK